MRTLEQHYRDMQDVEFTIEEGVLYMLQTRSAKRPAQAAVRVAVDMVSEGLIAKEEALQRIDADKLDALMHPTFDPGQEYEVIARGVPASPGAAKGAIVFTADEAKRHAARKQDVILVRPFTEAEDVAGFHASKGILTSEGGKASHAALVARGMGRPCVAGASDLLIDEEAGTVSVDGRVLHGGDRIAINGTTGEVTTDDVPLVPPRIEAQFETILTWADEFRTLGVRANADNREDAARARGFGAEGIGLCRTEHMFQQADRVPKMRAMIMAREEEDRRAALDELLPLQQEDFEGLFEAMAGLPVTIRLLDPPLHEFLPNREDLTDEAEIARLAELEETNPMLGTRGCRLGILYPEIYEMQVRAILRAARAVQDRGASAPEVEIMIPLVDWERELAVLRADIDRVVGETGEGLAVKVGTMIELPRACLVADRIARARRLLQLRHERPHADGPGPVARRRRGQLPAHVPGAQDHRPQPIRDARRAGRRWARADRGGEGPRGKRGHQARHLRRARRRARQHRLLSRGRARLRELLALPDPDRPRGGRPGRDCDRRTRSARRRRRGVLPAIVRSGLGHLGPPPGRRRARAGRGPARRRRSIARCLHARTCAPCRTSARSQIGLGPSSIRRARPCSTGCPCATCVSSRRRARSAMRPGGTGRRGRYAARLTDSGSPDLVHAHYAVPAGDAVLQVDQPRSRRAARGVGARR